MNYEIKGYEDKEVRKGDVWKDGYGKQWEISDFFSEYIEKGITYCLTAENAVEETESFTIEGCVIDKLYDRKGNLVTYVGNVNDSNMPEPEPEPEPEHVFSQDLSEPYDHEIDEGSIVDNTIQMNSQPAINHNGEYYIKQAIHIYVDSDDLDRARILIKALKHIKEI